MIEIHLFTEYDDEESSSQQEETIEDLDLELEGHNQHYDEDNIKSLVVSTNPDNIIMVQPFEQGKGSLLFLKGGGVVRAEESREEIHNKDQEWREKWQ